MECRYFPLNRYYNCKKINLIRLQDFIIIVPIIVFVTTFYTSYIAARKLFTIYIYFLIKTFIVVINVRFFNVFNKKCCLVCALEMIFSDF